MKCIKITKPEHAALRKLLKAHQLPERELAMAAILSWFIVWLKDDSNRATWVQVPATCKRGQVSVTDELHALIRYTARQHNVTIQCAFETACATYRRYHQ